jgi:hypothetical protein
MIFKLFIFGALLLAGLQWLTASDDNRSRIVTWILFGVGAILAALYGALILGALIA